ncbi:MAG: MFS transporter [Chloroflexota bacterium]
MTSTPSRSLLRPGNLRTLFMAQSVSNLGSWIGLIALNVRIYDLTGSSLGVAGLFLFTAAPSLLFGLVGGVWVDRFARQKVMVVADSLRVALTLLLLATDNVTLFYGLVFLNATAGVLYRTAQLAIIPQVVQRPVELPAANALINTALMLTMALGPAVGGLLVSQLGVNAALGLDALSFGLSALLIARLRLTRTSHPASSRQTWRNLRAGLALAAGERPLTLVILTASAVTLGTGAVNALEIVYARTVLGVGEVGYGLLFSAWGVGLLAGTLSLNAWLRRFPPVHLLTAGVTLLGAAIVAYALAPTLPVAVAIGLAGGVGAGLQFSLLHTLLQTHTPSDYLGRVSGLFTAARDLTLFVSMLAAGALADRVGVPAIFMAAGLVILVAAGLSLEYTLDIIGNGQGSQDLQERTSSCQSCPNR